MGKLFRYVVGFLIVYFAYSCINYANRTGGVVGYLQQRLSGGCIHNPNCLAKLSGIIFQTRNDFLEGLNPNLRNTLEGLYNRYIGSRLP